MAYPEQRWDVIHVDFITDLKPTAEGFDSILKCTDRLTRFIYLLIATKKTDDAAETARRLFAAVFAVHGTPLQINSDRDVRWVAGFFRKELTRRY